MDSSHRSYSLIAISRDTKVTPVRSTAASYSNHSAGGFIDSREFHTSYRNDLLPFYDKEWVLDKLFKPSATLNTGPTLSQDDAVLDTLAMEVRANCAEALEAIDDAQNNKNDKEAIIQSSLCTLFQAIEEAVANGGYCTTRQYFRRFVPDTTPLVDESGEVKPDFILADVPEPDNGGLVTSPPERLDGLRRVMAHAFIKVKAKAAYSPVPAPSTLHKKAAKMTLVQGSDYACLLRAARPLITHLFGVFFCGNSFSIAHFDYSGIHISPQFFILPNDNAGLRQFIRVFLRMTMEMSPYELGCDPTCFLEPPAQTYYQAQFPSFAVTMGGAMPGSDKRNTWVQTVGKPLFSSHSFFGRGTSVWLAFNEDTHEPTILKNSWRTPDRDSEITIYQKIREKIGDEHVRGLATVTGGGDVYFEGEPLSVASARGSPAAALLDPAETNRVLHRVTLSQVGKPLYDYTCLEELGIALLDALHAHDKLCSHGILHRDISIGNVMILVDAFYNNDPTLLDPGKRVEIRNRSEGNFGGLLTDFDYAKILDPSDPSSSAGDGSPTGTPLFMASELLWSIYYQKPCPMHSVYHDLESFDWVALYAIYKHALGEVPTTHPLHGPLAREFARLFTAVSPKNVFERRIIAFSLDGIPSLLAYADSIAEPASESESGRLGAFLIGVWGELKATFDGHRDWQRRVDRERPSKKRRIHRPGREVVRYLSEKFRDFPAVAREVRDALATDSEAENSDDGTLDEAEDEEDAEGSVQLDPAFPVPCYKYEDQVLKVNVLIGK